MRLSRATAPVLGVLLVLQGAVAVLPHDHGCATAVGDALVVPSTADLDDGCLACTVHAPAAVAAAATSALDSTAVGSADAAVGGPGLVVVETGVFDPRGPPAVL